MQDKNWDTATYLLQMSNIRNTEYTEEDVEQLEISCIVNGKIIQLFWIRQYLFEN